MLKWSTVAESSQAAERVSGLIARVAGIKALYLLVVLASFVLLSGANDKWGG